MTKLNFKKKILKKFFPKKNIFNEKVFFKS